MTTRHGFSTTRIMLEDARRPDGSERTEYMRRWIFSTPWFTVRLHHIQESYYGAPHNHPWNFLSLILRGCYVEELYNTRNPSSPEKVLRRKAFRPVFRRTTAIHKVLLENDKAVWTLCITDGARQSPLGGNRWGFFPEPLKYVPWQVYDPNATEEV